MGWLAGSVARGILIEHRSSMWADYVKCGKVAKKVAEKLQYETDHTPELQALLPTCLEVVGNFTLGTAVFRDTSGDEDRKKMVNVAKKLLGTTRVFRPPFIRVH